MKRMRWLVAMVAVLSLFAAACSAAEDAAETATDAAGDAADAATDAAEDVADAAEDVVEDAMDDDEDDAMDEGEDAMEEPAELATDYGVTEDAIRVGMSADLSGPFAALTSVIVDAQKAYFDRVNENGGIAGREVELVILDNAYDVPTQLDNYAELSEESEEGVVMISQSTGSPHTSAIAADLADDDLLAVPLSWYSGWVDPDFGGNVFELYTNYCFEGMNGVEFLANKSEAANPTLAVVTRPGEYGQDGAAGAKIAAEALGLEIVYDGEGAVEGDDFTPIITELVAAQPDIVWITTAPSQTAQIIGGAFAGGLTSAIWSGSSPSYNVALLDTAVGPALDAAYFHSTYTALWGANEEPGMVDMMETLTERLPTANYAQADTFIVGWTEAIFTETVLRAAAESGDMTRAGVLAAANTVSVDFQGLAPDQEWFGDPNDFAVRESYIYDVVLADATVATPITEPGSSGLVLAEGPYVGDGAASFEFNEPCFISEG